jgi:geranylgeranyl diphosphate synthase, type II
MTLSAYLEGKRADVDGALERILPRPVGPAARLHEAMRYAVFSGGKRLRPVLALAACEAFGGRDEDVLLPAAALELVHTYSLVHDDLPAMDDDDLRRGRKTAHKEFGEAEAILAGDALLTLAFEVLARFPDGEPAAIRRAEAVAIVACRSGHAGMVGGQCADLEAERRPPQEAPLEWIHRNKTGALLSASAEIGALHAGATAAERSSMAGYGEALGLAFQIADDVLDRTGSAEALGKTPGKDEKAGKATYPARLGLAASRREAARLAELACSCIPASVADPAMLVALARYAVDRSH